MIEQFETSEYLHEKYYLYLEEIIFNVKNIVHEKDNKY